ncbi:MAG TPA: 2-oxoacid:acceptor oxidoreductase family protein, partial [Spirochaetota bacterium]|nr:2-oxoacid:acceptor oxidoreductase family protein [Spirochaetota bacterium]
MLDRIFNILIVGVGGQGIILASDIASKAAALAGFDSKKSEIHGMSQRGGSVFSHVRYGSKVYSPVIPLRQADILVSLEEMETVRWADFCSKDTIIILAKNR